MKKFIMIAIVVTVLASLIATPVLAKGKDGQSGKSNVGHLYLYEKTGDPDWDIVPDGAWGKMKYNLSGPTFDFVFNGHRLEAGTAYSLIYYADGWPGNHPGALIASGTSNADGDIHLKESMELDMDLPDPTDTNYLTYGAKVWLVPSSDYNATTNSMTAWNPANYLFEYNGITYDDTDIP